MLRVVNTSSHEIDPFFSIRNFWKKFNILDSIGLVDESWKKVSNSTLNKSWGKLLSELVKKESAEEFNDQAIKSLIRLSTELFKGT